MDEKITVAQLVKVDDKEGQDRFIFLVLVSIKN